MWTRPARCRAMLSRLKADNRGATAVEYGLIIACIVIVMVVSLNGLAAVTTTMWNDVSTKVINAQ
ncbi:MAG: Flp family type IVb pilin [Sphingomonas bacterium]|nr:Flp family type IVb pilin [Sphingomonas bacterium]